MTSTARPHSCTILPPYLLERVRRQGPRAAAAAEHTLALDGRVRSRRELPAARRGGDGAGTPTPAASCPWPCRRRCSSARPRPAAGPARRPHRAIHDAAHTTTLPGTLVRPEGGAATADQSVTDAYDHLGPRGSCTGRPTSATPSTVAACRSSRPCTTTSITTTPSGTAPRWSSATGTAATSTGSPTASTSSATSSPTASRVHRRPHLRRPVRRTERVGLRLFGSLVKQTLGQAAQDATGSSARDCSRRGSTASRCAR